MRTILLNEANRSCILKDNTFVTYVAAWSYADPRQNLRGLDPVSRIKRRQAELERKPHPRGILIPPTLSLRLT